MRQVKKLELRRETVARLAVQSGVKTGTFRSNPASSWIDPTVPSVPTVQATTGANP